METKQSLTRLVFFAGYSNSGKTTHCIPILKNLGYEILSSSVLMHEFGDRVAQEVFNLKNFDSYDRLDWLAGAMGCSNNSAEDFVFYSRQWLIDLAEKALVPTFTRAVFAHAIADQIMANPETKFAIEVFKQEEFELLVNRLHSTGCLKKAFCFNLRRLEEDPLIDGRTLLSNAIEINNDSTYENLAELIANFLSCR